MYGWWRCCNKWKELKWNLLCRLWNFDPWERDLEDRHQHIPVVEKPFDCQQWYLVNNQFSNKSCFKKETSREFTKEPIVGINDFRKLFSSSFFSMHCVSVKYQRSYCMYSWNCKHTHTHTRNLFHTTRRNNKVYMNEDGNVPRPHRNRWFLKYHQLWGGDCQVWYLCARYFDCEGTLNRLTSTRKVWIIDEDDMKALSTN